LLNRPYIVTIVTTAIIWFFYCCFTHRGSVRFNNGSRLVQRQRGDDVLIGRSRRGIFNGSRNGKFYDRNSGNTSISVAVITDHRSRSAC
jgi:hypothetical protein